MPCERLLYVMRHGLTNWNQSRRIQGHLDPPLNATGRAQARLVRYDVDRELNPWGLAVDCLADVPRVIELAGGEGTP